MRRWGLYGITFGSGAAFGFGVGFVVTIEIIDWLGRKGLPWPPYSRRK